MYLIKNAKIYAPEYLGILDVLIGGGKILKIAKDLPAESAYDVEVIDGTGKILFPGLIDAHVHILGGGGEGGAKTRTPEQITFSSDGQGSLPVFAPDGTFLGLGVGKVTSMYREMKDAVLKDGVSMTDALKPVTSNPAKLLKLEHKGKIAENADADLVLAEEETLELLSVFAKGNLMIHEKEVLVKGTFE